MLLKDNITIFILVKVKKVYNKLHKVNEETKIPEESSKSFRSLIDTDELVF